MEITHRVAFNADTKPDFKLVLDQEGIQYKVAPLPGHSVGLVSFDIAESDPHWKKIAELIEARGASDIAQTVFTKKEMRNAEWLRLIPTFERGYPQPEEDWVTDPINYQDHCSHCGTFRQVANFRIQKEPKMGTRDFLSLYWTYALFCTSRVHSELEMRGLHGYEVWDVLIHETGLRSESISQLFIPTVSSPGLEQAESLQGQVCPVCHITKYLPHRRGAMYLRREALPPELDIIQTYEWFGSKHGAYREILVSNRLAQLILDKGWKGVALKVVELV